MLPPEDVIASRELCVTDSAETVLVQIGRPTAVSNSEAKCSYRLVYRGNAEGMNISGVDSFQALQLALKALPIELRHRQSLPLGQMYYLEPGDDMGFPEVSE
jgi:hypothetical protein